MRSNDLRIFDDNNFMKTIFALVMGCLLSTSFGGVTEDRAKAKTLLKGGNWKESLAMSEALLREVSDEGSGEDFDGAMICAYELPQGGLVDGIFDLVDEHHLGNASVLMKAGKKCETMGHDGMIIGGEFVRGRRKWQQGAQHANAEKRDRVRGLNYYIRGLEMAKEKREKQLILSGLGSLLSKGRQNNQSWRLQLLTNLDEVPEIEVGSRYSHYNNGTGGAPVDEKNEPIFYELPPSWGEAKNDGERWRWAMDQEARVEKNMKRGLDRRWADFLWKQFGVRSLQSYGFYRPFGAQRDDAEENKNGVMQLHTLNDDETVCRLATGVKRMTLPEGQNFMAIYRELYEGGSLSAGDRLVSIYLDRRQYVKGRDLLREIVKRMPSEQRRNWLKSIEGNWGKFDVVNRAFPVGEEPRVGMVYRNAAEVTLSAFRVDIEALQRDRWEYLKSNPAKLDYKRIQWNRLAGRLLTGHFNQFVGEKS